MQRPVDRLLEALVYGLAVVAAASLAALLSYLRLGPSPWWAWSPAVAVVAVALVARLRRWRRAERRRLTRLDRLTVRRVVSRIDPADDLQVVSGARLRGGRAPYVDRLIDGPLRRKLRERQFVLVVGKSKAGKSRTAYEAARAVLGDHLLVAPREVRRDTLDQVFRLMRPWDRRRRRVVVWLDDLDRYITAKALPVQLLEDWRDRPGSVVVLATMRESAYHRLVHPPAGTARSPKQEPSRQAAGILRWADIVALPDRLEGPEIATARLLYPGHDWVRMSLGATLALGPQLVDRYRTAAEATPYGVACVSAAIDWRRAGLTRPIRRSELREIHRSYVGEAAPRLGPRAGDFESGLRWALEPLPDSDVRLLYPCPPDGGEPAYEPDDYVLAHRDGQGEPAGRPEPVPDQTWREIVSLSTVTLDEALQVGFTALLRGSLRSALEVYGSVARRGLADPAAGTPEVTATALCGEADVLGRLDRRGDAIDMCDEVVTLFGDSDEPALQRPVAWSLVNKGVRQGELGRQREEISAYEEVERRFGDSRDAALCEQVAVALCNKGAALALLGELTPAIASYDEVVDRFGEAEQPGLREQVAQALYQKGLALEQLGLTRDAIASYDALLARLRELPPSGRMALALCRKAIALGQLGLGEEAIAVYQEVIGRFADEPDPGVREPVAWAMYNRAVRLGSLGRTRDEIAAYDEVVRRFEGGDEPELSRAVACALVNKGCAWGRLRQPRQEIAVCEEVERRFGGAGDPALRELLAVALYNKGVALSQLGKPRDAAAAHQRVVRRVGNGSDGGLRGVSAMAHFSVETMRRHQS